MTEFFILLTFLLVLTTSCLRANANILISIDFEKSSTNVKELKRFWTNTGFSPLEKDTKFFSSIDLNTNLEIIGSLPNKGLKNVRIHWLLDLLTIKGYVKNNLPNYEYKELDNFLEKLIFEYKLLPTIELMTSLKFKQLSRDFWEDFAYKIVSHFIEKFGQSNVVKWNFETWNEPDLEEYNKLNFTLLEYLDYVNGIKAGMNRISNEYSLKKKLRLRGPAGLFKDYDRHKFCWAVLEICNENITNCPIDVITFHRKGNGNVANEIIEGSLDLLNEFSIRFPKLSTMKYSNTEGDPIKCWSEPRDFQADCRYASILVETILQYWNEIYNGLMLNLDSISHDNSFMNFYPNIFNQRTLLARFQINNTIPKHVQFIQKPVFAALGLISNLGQYASNVYTINKNILYTISRNNQAEQFYSCIIITTHVDNRHYKNKTRIYEIEIKNLPKRNDLMYFMEAIDNKRTNPSRIYEILKYPKYPESKIIQKMRDAQEPIVLEQPTKVVNGKIFVNAQLMEPFVIAVRICSRNLKRLKRVYNLRIRKVSPEEIVLFWSDSTQKERCITSYEIFFKYDGEKYRQIGVNYIPFLYYQFKHTIPGCFKVRSKDFFDRTSKFSKEICISFA